MKGLWFRYGPGGQFVAEDTPSLNGNHGIGVGDGFHDYLIAGFVSCNHTGVLPAGVRIDKAQLSLRVSRVFGANPFVSKATIALDAVRSFARAFPVTNLFLSTPYWDMQM